MEKQGVIPIEIMTDRRFRKTIKYVRAFLIISLIGIAFMVVLITGILGYAKILGAPPLAVPQSTLYYTDDGTVLGESNSGQKRYWVPLEDISPSLIEATVSIEDKSFHEHHGFDYKRIAGAALADLKALSKVQGASTITQQYARNLFLAHEKTWKRKILEAFYTIRLEINYSKKDILEGYLNTIYYGNGAYGVEAASQFYFGKSAGELSVGEAALLAGIPKGPGVYSPFASMEKATERQKVILNSMVEDGYLKKEAAEQAAAAPLTLTGQHLHLQTETAAYFQDSVRNALKTELKLDDRTIALGGLKVYTTLNLEQQEIAEKTVKNLISKDSEIQLGLVAMNPGNGHVKAMVGGRDYRQSSFNRAVQAIRQPGSTIKPLLYYQALDEGFTPSSTMRSEKTTFQFEEGMADYTPHNYNNLYAEDDITMAQALAVSDNVFAVKTHLLMGEKSLVETIKDFGISTKMSDVPSLALGTSGVRVIDMANAYSLLANGGKKVAPVFIERVENHRGEVIYEYKNSKETILRPDLAFVMTHMMTGVFDRKLNGYTTVTGDTIIKDMTRLYAGKSGSTDTDSWMIGFAPQLVTAVWTGYDKGKPIELTAEKSYAKNVWVHFMEQALENEPIKAFKPPKGVVGVYVNPVNGKLATEDCPIKRLTYFAAGTEPVDYCTEHIEDGNNRSTEPKHPKAKAPWYKKIFEWIP
ncbi:transglycosylase domain-containing protein [Bacillus sp. V33-4]|uniref:transglycosylase domain-containing protein n=1 Tax=Bacillus sp. V33-4 TaxID=2054169 RepID=UPI002154FB41|nr:transglycosylase domain-containing protein [Bacillus sp. V33-4]